MKLEKAIEILTINNDHNPNYTDADREKAHQLGIEALKLVKEGRCKPGGQFFHDLPGETTE